mgnify:CR=1 FL=1
MIVIPALDLLDGKAVRLYKGKKEYCKVYADNPLCIVKKWKEEGAKLIHIVDLNAAFGEGDNMRIIKKIIKEKINIEIGGGIRNIKKAKEFIDLGVKRIIIGSKITDRYFLSQLIKNFSQKIAVSIDVFRGRFMRLGWRKNSGYSVSEIISYVIAQGVKWIIYTDIHRDGTLKGVNINRLKPLIKYKDVNFIISGGINSIKDIILIKKQIPFIKGVIIGKALYENHISLKEALRLT